MRSIVESANCIFQEIDQFNDIGNDAYIEFVRSEEATGCCIATQIKSGPSYVTPDGTFVIRADSAHFEYWSSHILPVCGIVFDPRSGAAGWCDITRMLRESPRLVEHGPFQLKVPRNQSFSTEGFNRFREHFMAYQSDYSAAAHFGEALSQFAPTHEPSVRIAALRALFSFHRGKAAMWIYVASLLRSVQDLDLLVSIVRALAHAPGHPDIYWHDKNHSDPAAKLTAVAFMKLTFGRDDALQLLRAVDEHGFQRGSIGQAVHALVNLVRDVPTVLRSIALDATVAEDVRYGAVFLFVFYAQEESVELCLATLEDFRRAVPDGFQDEVIVELARTLREHGRAGFY